MARLREGRANTARGAAHFLRETVSRVRYAGAKGQFTVRADSGFYTHGVVQVCRKTDVHFSITVRLRQNLRNLIEAIPESDWRPIPYWMEGPPTWPRLNHAIPERARHRAGTAHRPPGEAHARLPTGPLCQLQLSRHDHRPGGGYPGTGGRPPPPRRDRERHPGPQVRRGPEPSPLGALRRQWSLAGGAGHGPQSGPLDPAHRLGERRWQPPRPFGDASFPWLEGSPARPASSPCTCPGAGPGNISSVRLWPGCAPCHSPPDAIPTQGKPLLPPNN